MSRFTRAGMRCTRFMQNLDAVVGGSVDERLAEAMRTLRKEPHTTIKWCARTEAETREVGALFRLLGYRTKVSTDDESTADFVRDVLESMSSGRPYQVTVWTDGSDSSAQDMAS